MKLKMSLFNFPYWNKASKKHEIIEKQINIRNRIVFKEDINYELSVAVTLELEDER